jgi:hypothetical protein
LPTQTTRHRSGLQGSVSLLPDRAFASAPRPPTTLWPESRLRTAAEEERTAGAGRTAPVGLEQAVAAGAPPAVGARRPAPVVLEQAVAARAPVSGPAQAPPASAEMADWSRCEFEAPMPGRIPNPANPPTDRRCAGQKPGQPARTRTAALKVLAAPSRPAELSRQGAQLRRAAVSRRAALSRQGAQFRRAALSRRAAPSRPAELSRQGAPFRRAALSRRAALAQQAEPSQWAAPSREESSPASARWQAERSARHGLAGRPGAWSFPRGNQQRPRWGISWIAGGAWPPPALRCRSTRAAKRASCARSVDLAARCRWLPGSRPVPGLRRQPGASVPGPPPAPAQQAAMSVLAPDREDRLRPARPRSRQVARARSVPTWASAFASAPPVSDRTSRQARRVARSWSSPAASPS